ncbi:UPF0481 protein At3g47200-like [Impatiens glandulifera]|uniref:UPF0481 protein At3g47200-like n=1 Tax=Impatiens glandulifera TaxID=253017 RepID=UPI001FB09374|nr:UPF0481 protein At3g47200-like [Impatiens glandulifera]
MVSKLFPIYPERCIFRVPDALRHGNEEFYEPTVLAIGPYHRGKPRLASMEDQKIRNLKELLNITGDQSVDRFVRAIMPHEEKVRKCYSEPIDYLSSNELVQMLVLDGCFIIQLFRRYWRWSESSKVSIVDDDPVINSSFLLIELQKDMLLIENQIPFFIIEILFNTIYPRVSIGNELKRLTLVFYYKRLKRYAWTTEDHTQLFGENVCHLLQIAHMVVCSDFTPATSQSQTQLNSFVYSATKLEEANVRLKTTSKLTRSIFDITFRKGELEIPGFNIDDDSEVEIRNFIAFELCQRPSNKRFFSHYVIFMDHLIASSDDVDLLTRRGIFNNQMIEAKSVDNMLSKLTRNIISSNYYTYNNISKDLNEYCERPWNKWSANLKQKYFNTPWAIISFIAALVLLGLTITQTLFSIISYK